MIFNVILLTRSIYCTPQREWTTTFLSTPCHRTLCILQYSSHVTSIHCKDSRYPMPSGSKCMQDTPRAMLHTILQSRKRYDIIQCSIVVGTGVGSLQNKGACRCTFFIRSVRTVAESIIRNLWDV